MLLWLYNAGTQNPTSFKLFSLRNIFGNKILFFTLNLRKKNLMLTPFMKQNNNNNYLMCDIWPYVARVPATFDDHTFMLVAVQQLERLSNLEETKRNKIFTPSV